MLILGGGATACSALAAARGLGAAQVTVAVRDPARAQDLLAAAARLAVAVTLTGFDDSAGRRPRRPHIDRPRRCRGYLCQTDSPSRPWSPGHLLDVVYHPWPTPLAAAAREADIPLAGGLDLLLHQAADQVTLMTGKPAPLPAMRQQSNPPCR